MSNNGYKQTSEHIEKRAAANRGQKRSLETRAKISAATRGLKKSPEHCAKIGLASRGRSHEVTPGGRAKISAATRGEKNHSWKGGRIVGTKGYVDFLCPGHPFANSRGYVREHRLIAEAALGRYLKSTELVHHHNESRADNRNDNLVICQDERYHRLLHTRAKRLSAMG